MPSVGFASIRAPRFSIGARQYFQRRVSGFSVPLLSFGPVLFGVPALCNETENFVLLSWASSGPA
jgi:hypothetical protein